MSLLKGVLMKLEVINRSTRETIATYSVSDFSMFDFQEWKGQSKVVINLDCLSATVADMDSNDPETQKPVSNPREVDFYLPDPIKTQAISQLAKSQMDTEESPDQSTDRLNEVTEQVSTPELKSSTILSAIVTEILQNHHPHSEYEMRISDG